MRIWLWRLKNISFTTLSLALLLFVTAACHSSRSAVGGDERNQLAQAARRLGFSITKHDNRRLMIVCSQWLGTPYRYGGNDRRGVDCSGLTSAICSEVFHVKLHRNSSEQQANDCKRVGRKKLQQGNLVFFAPDGKKRHINHVGIYLKNDLFIHASTSGGVVLSRLSDRYWQSHWVCGGRIR